MTFTPAMPPHPPPAPPLSPQDEESMRILSILFYVYSGFVGLSALIFGAMGFLGFALLPEVPAPRSHEPDPRVIGGVLLVVFGAAAVLLLATAVMMVVTGRAFGQRRNYVLCWVGACVALPNIPLGTALGLFAILTLQKPGVKPLFNRAD